MLPVLHIIVADDHTLVRRGLVSLLSEIAASVTEAANGKEVLDILSKEVPGKNYDLVLMDVEMPVMDGITAVACISKDFPGVKVLMLTMMNNAVTIRQCIASGAAGFVYKNASEEELREAIEKNNDRAVISFTGSKQGVTPNGRTVCCTGPESAQHP
jgi:DNA-binding NarL/FixJ family response regulator